jgi:hypothetical protein
VAHGFAEIRWKKKGKEDMSETVSGSVKETGADAHEILIGVQPMNQNLLIKIHKRQEPSEDGGGRIVGAFQLLYEGNGYTTARSRSSFGANLMTPPRT